MNSREVAEIPTGPVPVPEAVTRVAQGDDITPVWRNSLGGLTFRLDAPGGDTRFVKWVAHGTAELDLAAEARRLDWASNWVRVPHVLHHGACDDGEWLVTTPVPGRSAVDPRWLRDPATAATAVGTGLRLLHEALPVADCAYEWSVESRLRDAEGDIRARLADSPPTDREVVCHGDACAPNTLLHDDGTVSGHVDLGSLGVADRWADLAVAAWSVDWNHGPGYARLVFRGYDIEPDPDRLAYYRLLWDLT
ncbi:aminoglycoside 3'-phosphotransferase [Saccharomonospora piscinae]|uniref:aminoglycoside 3'-phosphotransferase n=1 Tax=Saccharomonospora piscinae TaxID=687388 RepID=UPI0004662136|nr:aminoglycoside 3'-phosphotransferase [Saccharomonospora piscinae]